MVLNLSLSPVKPYQALMSLVFAVALGAAWSMLPDDSELIAMLERDGHSRDALEILEEDYAGGDRRNRTLHQMLALYENEGNIERARVILEEMAAQRPRDAALRDRLGQFYRATGDGKAYLAAMKARIELRYNEAACRDYIAKSRLDGAEGAEVAALQLCRQKGYRRPDDLARLAELSAAAGDLSQAATLLRAIDDVKRLKQPDERLFLLSMLLEQGLPKEAERRAVRWIKSAKDPALAVSLVDALARSKYPESALSVAKEAGEAGDSLSLTVAERLLERSEPQVARLYLRGWLDNAQFENEDVATRFVTAALDALDPQTALAGARKYGLSRLPVNVAAELARRLTNAALKGEAAEVLAANKGAAMQPDAEANTVGAAGSSQYGEVSPLRIPAGDEERRNRPHVVTLEQSDPLYAWRRMLSARISDDAQRKVAALGFAMPRPAPAAAEQRGSAAKVLRKTGRVLQRNTKLKSLKLRQKLVRERAAKRSKT